MTGNVTFFDTTRDYTLYTYTNTDAQAYTHTQTHTNTYWCPLLRFTLSLLVNVF
jgi:hypothetical protein